MRWKVGGRPRKSCMSCAVFWTSTRGEADDQPPELDFARGSADARLDIVAFHLAGRGAGGSVCRGDRGLPKRDRKSTRLNSSHLVISYAVFCLKKKKQIHVCILASCQLAYDDRD